MPTAVKNLTNGDVNISGLVIGYGATKNVDFVTKAIQAAKTSGKVSLTPDNGAASDTTLTAAAGTAIGTKILADVGSSFNQGTLNNNFKTIAAEVARVNARLNNIEARLNDLPIYQH